MYGRISTLAFVGIEARPVQVEVRISPGQHVFAIVGLPDKAVAESRERVRNALHAIGLGLRVDAHHSQSCAGRSTQGGQPFRPADCARADGGDGGDLAGRHQRVCGNR